MAAGSREDLQASTLGVVDNFRRTWDKDKYEQIAKDRNKDKPDSTSESVKRELLKARDYKVDLDSKLGKTLVVTKNTPQSQSGGYFCDVCDCVVKDSINFLDHINGRKHQRNIGMSMKVERSTVDQIKQRFEFNKKKKEEIKKKYDFEERMKELREDEEQYKEHRREKRKERKRKARGEGEGAEEEGEVDPEMAAMMGFAGFGAKRKS